jgi:hypothetical protein
MGKKKLLENSTTRLGYSQPPKKSILITTDKKNKWKYSPK